MVDIGNIWQGESRPLDSLGRASQEVEILPNIAGNDNDNYLCISLGAVIWNYLIPDRGWSVDDALRAAQHPDRSYQWLILPATLVT